MHRRFTFLNFLTRWLVAAILVLALYNPSGWSYWHWVMRDDGNLPLKVLAGVGLLILFVIYLRATWRSIGPIGTALAVAFLATIVWTLAYYGILDPTDPGVAVYLLQFVLATVMAVGLSWSHVRRRLSGQADVDDVET